MKIELEITEKDIADTLCSAFEGGINYWVKRAHIVCDACERTNVVHEHAQPWGAEYTPNYIWAPLTVGGSVQLKVHDGDPMPKPLNLETLQSGIKLMAEKYPRHFADMIGENGDATTGDVLIQLCVFGELVFG